MLTRRTFLQSYARAAAGGTALSAIAARPSVGHAAPSAPVVIASCKPLTSADPLRERESEPYLLHALFPPIIRIVKQTTSALDGWEPLVGVPSEMRQSNGTAYIEIQTRPGFHWTDGKPTTIDDVMRGLGRGMRAAAGDPSSAALAIDHVDRINDSTCHVMLKRPDIRVYKEFFARTSVSPLRADIEQLLETDRSLQLEHRDYLDTYVMARETYPSRKITLHTNQAWPARRPGIADFIVQHVADLDEAVEKLHAQELQIVPLQRGRPLSNSNELIRQFGDLVDVVVTPQATVTHVSMDTRVGPARDQRVRQAVRMAIDPARVARAAFGEAGAVVNTSMVPRGLAARNVSDPARNFYDPKSAKTSLAQAGVPGGFTAALFVPAEWGEGGRRLADAISADLREVGVALETVVVPSAAIWNGKIPLGNLALWDTPFAPTALAALANLTSGALENISRFSNAEFDNAIGRAATSLQADTSNAALARATEILDSAVPTIGICQVTQAVVHAKSVRPAFDVDGRLGDLADFQRA